MTKLEKKYMDIQFHIGEDYTKMNLVEILQKKVTKSL